MAHGTPEAELSSAHPPLPVMSVRKPQPRSHWTPAAGLLAKSHPHCAHWLPCLSQQPQPAVRTVTGQESLPAHIEGNLLLDLRCVQYLTCKTLVTMLSVVLFLVASCGPLWHCRKPLAQKTSESHQDS